MVTASSFILSRSLNFSYLTMCVTILPKKLVSVNLFASKRIHSRPIQV